MIDYELLPVFKDNYYGLGHCMMDYIIKGKVKECEDGLVVDEVDFGKDSSIEPIKDVVYKGLRIVDGHLVIEEDKVMTEVNNMFEDLTPNEFRRLVIDAIDCFNEGVMDRSMD